MLEEAVAVAPNRKKTGREGNRTSGMVGQKDTMAFGIQVPAV